MRKILEDFYYGNLRPSDQQMTVNSKLQRAVDTVTQRESQLEEQLDDEGKKLLSEFFAPSGRWTASRPWKTSSWVSGWVFGSWRSAWIATTATSAYGANRNVRTSGRGGCSPLSFLSEDAGSARQFQSTYRFEKSPANGGAEAPAARGGEGASIARMYIPHACRGKSPCPLCRLRAEDQRPWPQEGEYRG